MFAFQTAKNHLGYATGDGLNLLVERLLVSVAGNWTGTEVIVTVHLDLRSERAPTVRGSGRHDPGTLKIGAGDHVEISADPAAPIGGNNKSLSR